MDWNPFGTMFSGLTSYLGNRETNSTNRDIANDVNLNNQRLNQANNAFSAAQVQKQMDYETNMSNTSWQRGVKDMVAAGINPMLAVSKGGAGTPSVGAATPSSLPYQTGAPAVNNMSNVVSSALDFSRTAAQIENLAHQNAKIDADRKVSEHQPDVQKAHARSYNASAHNAEADNPLHQLEGSGAGLGLRVAGKVLGLSSSALNSFKAYKSISEVPHLFGHTPGGTIYNRGSGEISHLAPIPVRRR